MLEMVTYVDSVINLSITIHFTSYFGMHHNELCDNDNHWLVNIANEKIKRGGDRGTF